MTDVRDAFFNELVAVSSEDPRIVVLTDDMGAFGLEEFRRRFPARYFNPGIAEQNLINVASGLALGGMRPVVYGIATFMTLRCLEQIRLNVCWPRLPVVIVASGPGYAYAYDGPTHHAVQDIAIMRSLPGLTILNPSDAALTAACARQALTADGPSYLRLEKGVLPSVHQPDDDFTAGFRVAKRGRDLTIVASGFMVHLALQVAAALENGRIDAGVIDLFRPKPIDPLAFADALDAAPQLVVLDEHSETGGLSSIVAEAFIAAGRAKRIRRFALPDAESDAYGSREWLLARNGLDVTSLVTAITSPVS